MKIYVYMAADTHGNKVEGVVSESCDTLFLSGLRDAAGESQSFESESYHLSTWAKTFGFSVTSHVINLDLDKRLVVAWDVEVDDCSK